ncbi:hypothetical protein SARC_00850 [Sphaeroforma arctica JP610]|uniref:Uncharacterized protein n=1 Tax=Sphaeroforma arctica JP610 TaxID=667725 RepID=A0A0L0GDF8_9EUKA|nr:hypothetical protein SARC_00850 [Sphaeroforma arctica JP610]KNC87040.1 hypothetical protein SARC_00850 [Sphaeroforma arctica JP610]|eukprot:XP_014160942.1 hypothetical protein SARC_00850 [Sphaeroforma arctica JP610]
MNYVIRFNPVDHPTRWDTVQNVREFEADAFAKCVRLFMTENGTHTLDDEQVGSRAKDIPKKSKARKKKPWGFKSDAVACANFFAVLLLGERRCVQTADTEMQLFGQRL